MGRPPYKQSEESIDEFEKKILSKLCMVCRSGTYGQHPENPHKYVKCCLCGATKEVSIPNKPDEDLD